MNNIRAYVYRVALFFLIAIPIAALSLLANWQEYRHFHLFSDTNWSIRRNYIDELFFRIEYYRFMNGHYPIVLEEVDDLDSPFRHNGDGEIVDYYDNPIQYDLVGETFTVFSFGRDGRPGGDGLDADVYSRWTGQKLTPPTLRQFYRDCQTKGLVLTSLIAGAVGGLLAVPTRNRKQPFPNSWKRIIVRIGITCAASVIAALFIGIVHLPSGH